MNTIYLPCEVYKRELISRAMLGVELARKGNRVFIFEHTFFDRIGWPSGGIYIGKNVFRTELPHSYEYYNKMKNANVDIWFLEEEGGIYIGENIKEWESMLAKRFDFTKLDTNDKVLFWGEWQKKYYEEMDIKAEKLVSGSPNFDVYQEKYAKVFNEYDLEQTGGRKDYILVNTRFAIGNSRHGANFSINNWVNYKNKNIKKDDIIQSFIENNFMLYEIISLVIELANKMPKQLIIIRPHPGEDTRVYKRLTKHLGNVEVIMVGSSDSWIRQCRVLIHNGCSTGIQAVISKKNVISYNPEIFKDIKNFIPGLPNTIGLIASTRDQVFDYINNLSQKQHFDLQWRDTISRLNSIEFISAKVKEQNRSYNKYRKVKIPFIEYLKFFINSFIYFFTKKNIREKYEKLSDFKSFPKIVDIANNYYGSNVKCKKISTHCYELLKN